MLLTLASSDKKFIAEKNNKNRNDESGKKVVECQTFSRHDNHQQHNSKRCPNIMFFIHKVIKLNVSCALTDERANLLAMVGCYGIFMCLIKCCNLPFLSCLSLSLTYSFLFDSFFSGHNRAAKNPFFEFYFAIKSEKKVLKGIDVRKKIRNNKNLDFYCIRMDIVESADLCFFIRLLHIPLIMLH
jgi:hypothetical protein